MVADPKALQYIFQGYNFPKKADFRQTIRLLTGTGLLYVEGTSYSSYYVNFQKVDVEAIVQVRIIIARRE